MIREALVEARTELEALRTREAELELQITDAETVPARVRPRCSGNGG